MAWLHCTCVVVEGIGVLLRGPSGSGKSDLALRLIAGGAMLVADDRADVIVRDGVPVASAPATGVGLLEVRGLGIVATGSVADAVVRLVVDLVAPDRVERLPEEEWCEISGLPVRRVMLASFEPSAAAKVVLAARVAAGRLALAGSWRADTGMTTTVIDDVRTTAMQGRAGAAAMAGGASHRPVAIVTGMSGAGKSSALKALEDMGYEAVDNLPLSLLALVVRGSDAGTRPLALCVDTRTRDFGVESLGTMLDELRREGGIDVRLIFIDCDDEVLRRRFTETRRRHPLAIDRPVTDGIRHERLLMAPLRDRADLVLDTSHLPPGELKRMLECCSAPGKGLVVFVSSFAYRQGLPREADLVFDVRFLKNPHYEPDLKPKTGRDPDVADYVASDPAFAIFFDGLTALLGPLLPRFTAEGKSYLTIAIGCTGGRHRSVFVAERLAAWLVGRGERVELRHRELEV